METIDWYRCPSLPVLEVEQFIVNLLDIHLSPDDVEVAIDALHHSVVETVELLQQRQLFAYALKTRVVGDGQAKQLLAGAVRVELAPQVVESTLHVQDDDGNRNHLQNA